MQVPPPIDANGSADAQVNGGGPVGAAGAGGMPGCPGGSQPPFTQTQPGPGDTLQGAAGVATTGAAVWARGVAGAVGFPQIQVAATLR